MANVLVVATAFIGLSTFEGELILETKIPMQELEPKVQGAV